MKCTQLIIQKQIKYQKKCLIRKDNLFRTLSKLKSCQPIIESSKAIRERIYSPLQTMVSFIKQILSEDKSCSKAVIQLAASRCMSGEKAISILTGGYVKARQRLLERTVHQLVVAVGEETQSQVPTEWKVFGRDVKVCDGTTMDMPDTEANRAQFPPHHNGKRAIGFPLARLVAVMSLTTGCIIDYAIDAFKGKGTGEIALLRRILGCLKEQDILIADRLYCNFF